METSTKKSSDLNIWAFWKAQKPAWRVTVIRTSLERFGYKLVLPYLSLYVILMGATTTQLGLVTSLGLITAGLIGPWLGQQIDRHGPKKMYIFGIAVLILGYIAFGFAKVWQVAALGMFLHQMGQTLGGQSCANICGNCLTNCDRGKGVMVCETLAAGALGMLAPMLAGWIMVNIMNVHGDVTDPNQVRPLFFITLICTVISLFVVIFKLDVRDWGTGLKTKHSVIKDGVAILKADINCVKWVFINSVSRLPNALVIPYLQLFASEVKGATAEELAIMTTAIALTSVLCGYMAGVIGDKIGRKKVLIALILLYCAGLLLLINLNDNRWLILVGILAGFQEIGAALGGSIQHELVPARIRGRWSGVNSLFGSMVSASMAALAGMFWDNLGPQWVFLIYIGFEMLLRIPLLVSLPETLKYKVDESKFSALDA
ncbi:MAG: MFS transporter [Oscillospiraceae bacterium]|nr:MFS transporter [Oscillospiraceae bacterium]